jgi:hypothetical protein
MRTSESQELRQLFVSSAAFEFEVPMTNPQRNRQELQIRRTSSEISGNKKGGSVARNLRQGI